MQCDSTENSSMSGNLPVGAQTEVLLPHGHQCHCQCCFHLDWFLQECYCLVWWAEHWGCQMKLRLSLWCTTWAGSRLARHESKAPAYRTNVSCGCARSSGVIPTNETGHIKLCLPEMSYFCWEIKANQQLPAMLVDVWESIGLPLEDLDNIPHLNNSPSENTWQDLLDDKALGRIKNLYAEDFEVLNYK